jgi:hypothetical protein
VATEGHDVSRMSASTRLAPRHVQVEQSAYELVSTALPWATSWTLVSWQVQSERRNTTGSSSRQPAHDWLKSALNS